MLAYFGEATQQDFDHFRIWKRFDEFLHVEEVPAQALIVHSAQELSAYRNPVVNRHSDILSTCCSCMLLCFAWPCLFRQVY